MDALRCALHSAYVGKMRIMINIFLTSKEPLKVDKILLLKMVLHTCATINARPSDQATVGVSEEKVKNNRDLRTNFPEIYK